MRTRSLALLAIAAGAALLTGCTQSQNDKFNSDASKVGHAVTHGKTIEGTDINQVKYAPLVVYIAPGETPPYGKLKFKPVNDE